MNEEDRASGAHSSASAIAGHRTGITRRGSDRASTMDTKDAKVLIVDDTPANLDLLRDMLKPLGAHIFFATSGAMALDIAKNAPPDLILLDIMMPEMDGLETCRRLKASRDLETIPIIFVTAKTEVQDLVMGFKAGGVDYITKPVKQPEVHARVNAHLRIQGIIRQQQETLSALELARKELQELNGTKDKFLSSIGRALRDALVEIYSPNIAPGG
jgi:DNA-binding response OmpR family regulator